MLFGGDTSWNRVPVSCPFRADPPHLPRHQMAVPYVFFCGLFGVKCGAGAPSQQLHLLLVFSGVEADVSIRKSCQGKRKLTYRVQALSVDFLVDTVLSKTPRYNTGGVLAHSYVNRCISEVPLKMKHWTTSVYATTMGRKSRICDLWALKTVIAVLETLQYLDVLVDVNAVDTDHM